MKGHLLFKDREARLKHGLTSREDALVRDLGLDALFSAMCQEDDFLREVAVSTILDSLTDVEAIRYRQAILRDCIANETTVRDFYQNCLDAIAAEQRHSRFFFSHSPSSILSRALSVLEALMPMLRRLRQAAEASLGHFQSEGFVALFAMLRNELDDRFFGEVGQHLRRLQFRNGALVSARLGKGAKSEAITLRTPLPDNRPWLARLLGPNGEKYAYNIHPKDENGFRALAAIKSQGINSAANAMGQSTDHIVNFFQMLKTELAFYIGCLNARTALMAKGLPTCFPSPGAVGESLLTFRGLYDVNLALISQEDAVSNDLDADGKDLLVVTGANQGGKTTFLHAVGQAQLMMQAGMFAAGLSFAADLRDRIFTHFKREEDATMSSGKLDEELARMGRIVDDMTRHSLVLFNESFAATNDREGSEINGQIVSALVENGVKVVSVTHLYEFARRFHDAAMKGAIFLRADRREDGTRTFKIREGAPLQTSFGEDLYEEIFDEAAATPGPRAEVAIAGHGSLP
ncbi:DNA mismatch repair protein MutS [Rhodoblastus sp.]|uniref:MutS-related protein n=1 Tax=Rhodoblastus sp. TaxID=1962975 RepID=UPI00261DBC44|nr:DNA mismatch repair protein MutS [Rhodoblastus sp.]